MVMKKGLIKNFASKVRTNKLVRTFAILLIVIMIVVFGGYGINQYRLSRIDCTEVTKTLSAVLKKKQYSQGQRSIKLNDPACSKDVGKLKNNKDRVVSHEYNAVAAKILLSNGNKESAKVHVRKSIDSLRSVDVTQSSPQQLKSYSTNIDLSADDILMLDYEINKHPDGSYEGYYGN